MTLVPASNVRAFDLADAESISRPSLFMMLSPGGHKLLVCNGMAVFLAGQWAGNGISKSERHSRLGMLIEGVDVELDFSAAVSTGRDRLLTIEARGQQLSIGVNIAGGIFDDTGTLVLRPSSEPDLGHLTPRAYFPRWRLVLPVRGETIVLHEQGSNQD